MTLFPLLVPFAVLTLCAYHDATSFKIPNRYVAVLLVGWPVFVLLNGTTPETAAVTALIAGLALLLGFALFALNMLGAGDVKLISATCLWVGPSQMLSFIIYTALLGGALSLLLFAVRARPLPLAAYKMGWLVQLHDRKRVMPYGVAIAGGAMIALAQGVGG